MNITKYETGKNNISKWLKFRENLVGFLQRFLRADVEPQAGHAPSENGRARVKPLHEASGLVGVVALGDVLLDERDGGLGIIIQRNAGEGAGRRLGFFLEERNLAGAVSGNGIVFFDLFQIADVVEREDGRIFLAAEFPEFLEFVAEKIVARHDDQIVVHVLGFDDIIDVANRAEFICIVGGMIVDDGEIEFGFGGAIVVRPFLEMIRKLGVGHDIDAVNAIDGREIVEDVLDHRFARDRQQWFGLREGERIEARGVSGSKDDNFHVFILTTNKH